MLYNETRKYSMVQEEGLLGLPPQEPRRLRERKQEVKKDLCKFQQHEDKDVLVGTTITRRHSLLGRYSIAMALKRSQADGAEEVLLALALHTDGTGFWAADLEDTPAADPIPAWLLEHAVFASIGIIADRAAEAGYVPSDGSRPFIYVTPYDEDLEDRVSSAWAGRGRYACRVFADADGEMEDEVCSERYCWTAADLGRWVALGAELSDDLDYVARVS